MYRAFFLFGFSVSLWQLLAYLHRNAPSESLSSLFFRFDLFFSLIATPALLLTILYLEGEKRIYPLILLPGLFVGLIAVLVVPFEIIWTGPSLGWSYKAEFYYMILCYVTNGGYSFGILYAGYRLRVKSQQSLIRRKYLIILLAFSIFNVGGMLLTSILLFINPNLPPFGGTLMTLTFLFIAYALYLPVEGIKHSLQAKDPTTDLSDAYLQMLNKLQTIIPGKELGVSVLKFDEYIEAMGLSSVVYLNGFEKLVFDSEKFAQKDIGETIDSVVRTLKEIVKPEKLSQEFSNAFAETYKILKSRSKDYANKWVGGMLHQHGGFFSRTRILEGISQEVRIPRFVREFIPGSVHLFKEEKPTAAYKDLKEALNHGFVSLCISNLGPEKVRKRYGVGRASIFWLTFEKGERTISPKDIDKLNKTVSEFVEGTGPGIVLLDCLDQIKFANGFQKSLAILKDLRNLCSKNDSIVLISANPEMFEKQELQAIETKLKGVRI